MTIMIIYIQGNTQFVFEKIPDWINNLVDVKQPRQKRLILVV